MMKLLCRYWCVIRRWTGSKKHKVDRPVLSVRYRMGKGGRFRWSLVDKSTDRVAYSSFPNSFDTKQEARGHLIWAASATLEDSMESMDSE